MCAAQGSHSGSGLARAVHCSSCFSLMGSAPMERAGRAAALARDLLPPPRQRRGRWNLLAEALLVDEESATRGMASSLQTRPPTSPQAKRSVPTLQLFQAQQKTRATLPGDNLPRQAGECAFQCPEKIKTCRWHRRLDSGVSGHRSQRSQVGDADDAGGCKHRLRLRSEIRKLRQRSSLICRRA